MSRRPVPRGLHGLPLAGASGPPAPRHETVLSTEPDEVLAEIAAAIAIADEPGRRAALLRVAGHHPAALEAWARLSELSMARAEAVEAYAFARVAYHRGLDRLRREGWGGTGRVHWARPTNRGFLRGLHALLVAAAALGELDESARCRAFLLELDPDDALGIAAYPEVPGPQWKVVPLPG